MRRARNNLTLTTAVVIAMMSLVSARCLAQDWAKDKLAKSSRHQEWVKVSHDNRDVNCFVVYPEVNDKAPTIIVIHEIFGLTDWVEDLTDQLAEAGYIAISPDLLWGKAANGEGTDAIIKADGAQAIGRAIQSLPPDQITRKNCRHATASLRCVDSAGAAGRRFAMRRTIRI
jgi:carboxymethylenebutenolidase